MNLEKYFKEKYLKHTCFDTVEELLADKTNVFVNAPRALIAVELKGKWVALQELTNFGTAIENIWEIQAGMLAREGEGVAATREELIEAVKKTVDIIDDLPDLEDCKCFENEQKKKKDIRDCPKCGTRMEEKAVIDERLDNTLYQCPNCKNIEVI